MARKYHITPEGPRPCSADPSKANSRGCKYGDSAIHFDNMADAMGTYQEGLQEKFGEFHVLIRPSIAEKGRRLGYQSMDVVEKVKASPQAEAAVNTLKTIRRQALLAAAELRGQYAEGSRQPILPDTIETRPLDEPLSKEDAEAEELSRKFFVARAQSETGPEYRTRLLGKRGLRIASPVAAAEQVEQTSDLVAANTAARGRRRKKLGPIASTRRLLSDAGIATRKLIGTAAGRGLAGTRKATAQARSVAANSVLTSRAAIAVAGDRISATSLSAKQNASAATIVARDKALRAGVLAKQKASAAGEAASVRISQMNIPAGHIRPGDTFDGTTVHSVEQSSDGNVKIRYRAKSDGPLFSATVSSEKSMRIDRKTRRQARNSRIANSLPKPISRTELSSKLKKATSAQIAMLKPVRSELRFESIEKSIGRQERADRQRELIGKLKSIRRVPNSSMASENVAKVPAGSGAWGA